MGVGAPGPGEVARAYVSAFRTGDPDAVAACVTDDFVNEHISDRGVSTQGVAEYRARLPGFLAEFRDLTYDIEDVVAEGDKVVVAYTLRACYQGTHPLAIRGVMRLRVAGGRIAHRADYWDGMAFLRQTGQA